MRTFVTFLIVSGAAALVGIAGLTVRFWPAVQYFGTYYLYGLLSSLMGCIVLILILLVFIRMALRSARLV